MHKQLNFFFPSVWHSSRACTWRRVTKKHLYSFGSNLNAIYEPIWCILSSELWKQPLKLSLTAPFFQWRWNQRCLKVVQERNAWWFFSCCRQIHLSLCNYQARSRKSLGNWLPWICCFVCSAYSRIRFVSIDLSSTMSLKQSVMNLTASFWLSFKSLLSFINTIS